MGNEKLLPKPQIDLPKPELDFPLPEKEIPAHAGERHFSISNFFRLPVILLILVIPLIVLASGAYLLGKNNANKQVSQTPTQTLTPTPAADPTADWKTYTSSVYKISFKYPKDWITAEAFPGSSNSTNVIGLIPQNKPRGNTSTPIYINRYENPKNLSLKAWDDERNANQPFQWSFYSESADVTTIGGLTAYRQKTNCEPVACEQVVIIADGYIFALYNLEFPDDYTPQELQTNHQIFEQILSTLKFTDSSLTPTPKKDEKIFCTQDAKLCPDGSYVGRQAPDCEFTPCTGN